MAYETPIFSIDPEFEKKIHPQALEYFRKFQDDVRDKVQQEQITQADLNGYLRDDEKTEFQSYVDKITAGLVTCTDIGDGYSQDNQAKLLLFEAHTLIPMQWIKLLLGRVYDRKQKEAREKQEETREKKRQEEKEAEERKRQEKEEERHRAEKAAAEQKRKEEEQRRGDAYQALNVPADDAIKYLSDEEFDKFAKSIPGAIDAYLEEGEDYALDNRSFWFNVWLRRIGNRRGEDEAKIAAAEQFRSFNDSLCKAIAELKSKLHAHKQNTDKYFDKDNHFPRQNLAPCLFPSQRKELLKEIEHMARGELKALVPEVYLDFISWENTYYYRLRPIADYVFEGVPCLAFSFEVEGVAESEIQLIPRQRVFRGYRFNLPVINNEGYRAVLQKPKFLGYFYQHLSPIKLPPVSWQAIPLNLLTGLMQGEIVPQGSKVIEASEVEITYEVKKFDELVDIPVSFQACLGEMQGLEGMVTAGVISNQTARIIMEQTSELKSAPIQKTPATEQPPGFTKEQFIEKVTGLGYPKAHAEILFQKIPEGLDLDEAVRWALREYRKIISENTIFESYYD